ncbi:unnamed protein product [Larinioides sclopetarius]|uniref:Nesprin-1 n=1 Tax=Larinioides sclopetarius TaxID=280406 RepID=A0AAV2B7L9_9ARAC
MEERSFVKKFRNLQKHWESLQEKCNGSLRAVDSCLQKLISFSQGQERLSKWLQEVGLSVQQHAEPKSTIQEKRAQLQSQKVIHQDILSHKPLLEAVCDKANELMAVTGDNTIPSYIHDVKMMYNAMCTKSEGLLGKLKDSINDHQKYLDDCRKFQEFLSTCHIKLQECKDTSGEKPIIVSRLNILKDLMSKQSEGDKMLSDLEKLCTVVCKNTSEHGCEILRHEMKELSDSWSQYNTALMESKCNLTNVIQQWTSFEKNMQTLNKWFKDMDAEFKKPQLQSTLEEKETQHAILKDLNDKVVYYQKDLDTLTDEAHSLTHSSGVESIKFDVSQLNVRYQNLVSLSKTLLHRWELIVQDHKAFERKADEFSEWLSAGQKILTDIETEESIEQSMIKLQVLVNDRLQGQQLLSETVQSGERLYQDTATTGRETIRERLRGLRDKFDLFSNSVVEVQRQLESLNQHWVSFKDTFKQILNWMDSADRTLSSHGLNLPSIQDINSRLLKYKALNQETEPHKRQLDLLQSKVQSVAPLMKEEDLPLSILEATARFNNLVTVIKEYLEKMEHLSNLYQQCQDHKDVCEEWCQKNEEQLILCSDFAGNRTVLKAKEEQLRNLKEHLPEGADKIQLYGKHVQQLSDVIATRDFEQLTKSHAAFEKRYQDIATKADETLREMTEKFKQWETFDEKCNAMTAWLENMEQRIKDFVLKTTLEEKIEQRDKFQMLVGDILANESAIILHSKIVESPERALLGELRTKEADFDVLSDESQELIAASGEMRISMGTSQIISRFQSMLLTCKELARKCEQHVEDHQQFNEKYKICSDWIENATAQYAKINVLPYDSSETLQKKLILVQELLQTKDEGLNMVSATVQYGEQLQVGSSPDGWETVQVMLQNLQTAFDKVFDDATSLERSLLSTQFVWSEFEETLQRLQSWIINCSSNFYDSPKQGVNLDNKKGLLRTYKALLVDINGHDRAVEDLQLSHDCVPTLDKNIDEIINNLVEKQKSLKSKSEEYIEFYENCVQEHDSWNKAMNDVRNWLNSTQTSIDACRDTNLDRISLLGSLRTIKNIITSFDAERPRLGSVEESFQKVLKSTHEDGKNALTEELKSLQSLFESTEASAEKTADLLEDLMNQWTDYEERVSEVQAWMKEIENSLQSICLKESLSEKRLQLEKLKNIQGEVREKELEIDALTDKMQQLQKGPSKRRISKLSELGITYQNLVSRARDTYAKWNQYVIDHQEFLSIVAEFQKHLTDLKQKLELCQTPEGTLEDIQEKLKTVQDIACEKEALSSTFQSITDKAQVVLSSTAPMGHSAINETIQSLQELLSTIVLNSSTIKVSLEDCLHLWSTFLHSMKQVSKVTDNIEHTLEEARKYQSTLAEKKCQLDKVKSLQHKIQQEKMEVDSLKTRSEEMIEKGPHCAYTSEAMDLVHRFYAASESINGLVLQNEQNFKNHQTFKSNCDNLVTWMRQLREKIPPVTRSLSDKLNLESSASILEELLAKKSQGQLKVDAIIQSGEIAMATSSESGKKMISTDMENLTADFQNLFIEIADLKEELDNICIQLREFKDEYEKVSEWLQVMETDVKAQKTTLKSTLEEKEAIVNYCKGVLDELEKGKESIEKLMASAAGLLASHLDTYIRNQLTIVSSRFQVLRNLAKDVSDKANTSYEIHKAYKEKLSESKRWIDSTNEKIKQIGKIEGNKAHLEKMLNEIQALGRKQDDGLSLVQSTIVASDKAARTSNQAGKDVIATEIHELQSQWDRLLHSISETKIAIETALLQWADYTSSEAKLIEWLTEHEQMLKEVKKTNIPPMTKENVNQRKTRLRKANSMVQDIVSFEPMIESIQTKAVQLHQPVSPEIHEKYQRLVEDSKKYRDHQQSVMDYLQQFMDSCMDISKWLSSAREKLSKCAMPSGDREAMKDKTNKIQILQSELGEGLEKLHQATFLGEVVKENVETEEEKCMIDEELLKLQEEYELLKANVAEVKVSLDVGVVKWNEYDEQYAKCSEWLLKMEPLVQSYAKPQANLLSKRARLQEFQDHLQTIFDYQIEFDKLNMKAQLLLETYSDSSISNAFTLLSRKYGALVSFSKEVMHQLEQHFQEHQQQQCMFSECIELIDVSKEKLNDCCTPSSSVDELNAKLSSLKVLSNSMDQAQNKIRYTMELTEKVIANTDSDGMSSIQEDADNLKTDFEDLLKEIAATQLRLTERLAMVGEFNKTLRQFKVWLEEIDSEIEATGKQELNSLIEKKSVLEKYSTILKDLQAHETTAKRLKGEANDYPIVRDEILECLEKYNNFLLITQNCTSQLTSEIEELEKFKNAYAAAETWLRDTKMTLHNIGLQADSIAAIEEKLTSFKKLEESLPEGEGLVKTATELGNAAGNNMGFLGRERISKEVETLNSAYEELLVSVNELKFGLERCLDAWNEFESSKKEVESWLSDIKNKILPYLESSPDIHDSDRLGKLKEMYDEIKEHKIDVDSLNTLCENLVEVSSYAACRDPVVSISGEYNSLSSNVSDTISKLEKYICNQGEFADSKNEFSSWYNQNKAILDENNNMKGDLDILQKRMHNMKSVSAALPEGQRLLDATVDCGNKALRVLPDAAKAKIKSEMDNMKDQYSELSKQTTEVISALSSVLSRLQEFAQNKNKLKEWLDNIKTKVPEKFIIKPDIVEVRTRIESFKQIFSDMENHKSQLKELQVEASELALKTGDESEISKVEEISEDFKTVHQKVKTLLTLLEKELSTLQSYNHELQEIEKWLLQMSFNLMSHHSLQISNLVKTREQANKHQLLLREIQNYQKVIDSLKVKGSLIINDYKNDVPTIENQINGQITNVQESYDSLLMTAENIQAQLEDALSKFKAYEDSLLLCERLLNETRPFISSGLDAPKLSSEDARDKLDMAKKYLKNLVDGREKLQHAIQGCVEATSSISRPSSPDVGFASSLPEKEMQIKIQLQDYIEQLQAFSTSLENIVSEWETLNKLKNSIEKWIMEKENFLSSLEAKPMDFNIEALNSRLHDLEDIKIQVTEKESEIDSIERKEKKRNDLSEVNRLREKLKHLDSRVSQLMNQCIAQRLTVEEMRIIFCEVESQLKLCDEKIDNIEKQMTAGSAQKKQLLQQSLEDLNSVDGLLTKLKTMTDKLRDKFSEQSEKEIRNRISNLDKRLEDLRNRCMRKIQNIELIETNVNSLSSELSAIQEWINEKKLQLKSLPKPGYQSACIEGALQEIKSIQRETLNKEIVIQSTEKKVESVCADIDQKERDSLIHDMNTLKSKFDDLCNALDSELSKVDTFLSKSKHFEKELDDIKQWLIEKERLLNRIEWFPGKQEELNEAKTQFVTEETIIKKYEETVITNVYKLGKDLEELCNSEELTSLNSTLDEIKRHLDQVKKLLEKNIKEVNKMIEEQKIVDESLEKIQSWLTEAESILSTTLRLDASIEVIEEQKSTYKQLTEESKKLFEELMKLQSASDKILPKMKSSNRMQLENELRALKERLHRIEDALNEKLQLLDEAMVQQKEQKWQLEESSRKLEEIKEEIQHLSKPLGPFTTDAEFVVESYEKILHRLLDLNERLQGIKPLSSFLNMYNNLLEKYSEVIQQVQDKHAKAKQSLSIRDQYHTLVKEINETVYTCHENLTTINDENIPSDKKLVKYQSILDDITQCEATFTKASDKGEQIAKEGTANDCNKIMEELQRLRSKLNELRKAVNKEKTQHENLIAEQKKYMHEMDNVLGELRSGLSVMQSQPLLKLPSKDVQKEIHKHKDLASDLKKWLNEASVLTNQIDAELQSESLPGSFMEQVEECNLFQQTLVLAMEEQLQYLKSAYEVRKEFEKISESLNTWLEGAEKMLDVSSSGVDFQNIDSTYAELQKYFSDISTYENQLSEIQKLGSQIHSTLIDDQVSLLEAEIECLKQTLHKVVNSADKVITEVEINCILWKEYKELFEKVSSLVKAPIPAEKPASISALNASIKKLSNLSKEMQKNQTLINELNEKARSLNRKANMTSADMINQKLSNINSQWQDHLCSLESQISALTDILNQWEVYSEVDKNVQSSLLSCERRLEDIMASQTISENSLKNLLEEVKQVGSAIDNLTSLSTGVLAYLNSLPSGSEAQKQIKNHLQDVRKRYQKLICDIESKLKQVHEESEAMKNLEEQVTVIQEKIHTIEEKIKLIDCYIDDLDTVDQTMTEVREEVTTITETVKTVTTKTKENFRKKDYTIPDSITKTLSSLELLSEATTTILEDKEREYKKARAIRIEYTEALDDVVAWLKKAQEQLQDKSNLPEVALEYINVLISEVVPIKSKLDTVRRNGLLIAESTRNPSEKQIILNSITSLEDQMSKVESWLYEREVQLKEAVNALRQFLESHTFIQSWISKVESYLSEDTEILSLADAKQKLSNLQGFSKESSQVQQHLKNMSKRFEKIGEVCSTGDLADMLDSIEQDESSTDSRLQEQLSLLQEMVEEWEQCERKIKEVASWVEKAKTSLESPHFKKRSLRDQLTTREKMMSDMSVQKTKVLMALEKLQVHLRSHIGCQHQILTRGQSVQEELETLHSQVEKQCETLQLCVVQEDQYQQDGQALKHAISQADHQLKLATSPSINIEEKDKLKELQQVNPSEVNLNSTKIVDPASGEVTVTQKLEPQLSAAPHSPSIPCVEQSHEETKFLSDTSFQNYKRDTKKQVLHTDNLLSTNLTERKELNHVIDNDSIKSVSRVVSESSDSRTIEKNIDDDMGKSRVSQQTSSSFALRSDKHSVVLSSVGDYPETALSVTSDKEANIAQMRSQKSSETFAFGSTARELVSSKISEFQGNAELFAQSEKQDFATTKITKTSQSEMKVRSRQITSFVTKSITSKLDENVNPNICSESNIVSSDFKDSLLSSESSSQEVKSATMSFQEKHTAVSSNISQATKIQSENKSENFSVSEFENKAFSPESDFAVSGMPIHEENSASLNAASKEQYVSTSIKTGEEKGKFAMFSTKSFEGKQIMSEVSSTSRQFAVAQSMVKQMKYSSMHIDSPKDPEIIQDSAFYDINKQISVKTEEKLFDRPFTTFTPDSPSTKIEYTTEENLSKVPDSKTLELGIPQNLENKEISSKNSVSVSKTTVVTKRSYVTQSRKIVSVQQGTKTMQFYDKTQDIDNMQPEESVDDITRMVTAPDRATFDRKNDSEGIGMVSKKSVKEESTDESTSDIKTTKSKKKKKSKNLINPDNEFSLKKDIKVPVRLEEMTKPEKIDLDVSEKESSLDTDIYPSESSSDVNYKNYAKKSLVDAVSNLDIQETSRTASDVTSISRDDTSIKSSDSDIISEINENQKDKQADSTIMEKKIICIQKSDKQRICDETEAQLSSKDIDSPFSAQEKTLPDGTKQKKKKNQNKTVEKESCHVDDSGVVVKNENISPEVAVPAGDVNKENQQLFGAISKKGKGRKKDELQIKSDLESSSRSVQIDPSSSVSVNVAAISESEGKKLVIGIDAVPINEKSPLSYFKNEQVLAEVNSPVQIISDSTLTKQNKGHNKLTKLVEAPHSQIVAESSQDTDEIKSVSSTDFNVVSAPNVLTMKTEIFNNEETENRESLMSTALETTQNIQHKFRENDDKSESKCKKEMISELNEINLPDGKTPKEKDSSVIEKDDAHDSIDSSKINSLTDSVVKKNKKSKPVSVSSIVPSESAKGDQKLKPVSVSSIVPSESAKGDQKLKPVSVSADYPRELADINQKNKISFC